MANDTRAQKAMKRIRWKLARHFAKRAFLDDLSVAMRQFDTMVALDVGAHHGEYGELLRSLGFRGNIESFEPVAQSFAILAAKSQSDPRWRAHPYAIGAEPGTLPINVTASTDFSSLRPVSSYGQAEYSGPTAVRSVEPVEVRRLDTVLDALPMDRPRASVLLKIDTQGFEREVLEGLGSWVEAVAILHVELAVRQLYEGSAQAAEIVSSIAGAGFDLVSLFPISRDSSGRVVEYDSLFVRSGIAGGVFG